MAGLGRDRLSRWLHPPVSDPSLVGAAPAAPTPVERMVTGRFLIVTLATFGYFIGLGSLLPTLPRYVKDELGRSEEHTSELQSLMRNAYAVFCLKKKLTTSL